MYHQSVFGKSKRQKKKIRVSRWNIEKISIDQKAFPLSIYKEVEFDFEKLWREFAKRNQLLLFDSLRTRENWCLKIIIFSIFNPFSRKLSWQWKFFWYFFFIIANEKFIGQKSFAMTKNLHNEVKIYRKLMTREKRKGARSLTKFSSFVKFSWKIHALI